MSFFTINAGGGVVVKNGGPKVRGIPVIIIRSVFSATGIIISLVNILLRPSVIAMCWFVLGL